MIDIERANVPESAELIAAIAGTKAVWVSTQQTEEGLLATGPSGKGSRRRGYEFQVHPSRIKRLGTGQAVLITPGAEQAPAVVLVDHQRRRGSERSWLAPAGGDGHALAVARLA